MIAMKESGIEWIGQIPQNWNIVRLGALASMIVPMRDKPTSFDGDIPWIRIEDFDGMYISKSKSEQNVSAELIKQMNMKIYPVGTVLCSCSCNLGKCAITTVPMCSNQTFIGVVPRGDLHNRFLYYVLSASEKILNNMSQGAIQSYLSQQDFSKFKIAITDFESQIKIADFLDKKCTEIDSIISAKEKINELLKERRQSIIYEAVTKGLKPNASMKDSGIEWIGGIPEDWDVSKIKYSFSLIAGATPKSGNSDYWDGDIVWITPADYTTEDKYVSYGHKNITVDGLNSCATTVVPEGSIIFSKRAPVGLVAINKVPLCTNQGCIACVPYDNTDSNFYYYAMSAFSEQFELYASGTTFKEISAEAFANFVLPNPSFEEQKTISEYLDEKCVEIDSLISANNSTIEKLKEYRQSVIYEAVTGKIEI